MRGQTENILRITRTRLLTKRKGQKYAFLYFIYNPISCFFLGFCAMELLTLHTPLSESTFLALGH